MILRPAISESVQVLLPSWLYQQLKALILQACVDETLMVAPNVLALREL